MNVCFQFSHADRVAHAFFLIIDGLLYVVGHGFHVVFGTIKWHADEVVSIDWDVIMALEVFDGFVPLNLQALYA